MRRLAGWALLAAAVAAAVHLARDASPFARMLAIIAALFVPLKVLVMIESDARLTPAQALAFCLWPGMRVEPFAAPPAPPLDGAGALARRGALRLAQGLALLLAARLTGSRVLMLLGLSLTVHFGVFNLLAGFWRFRGRDVVTLFDAPLHAKTLDEFWSKRWNRAFQEFTARVLYRPLARSSERSERAVPRAERRSHPSTDGTDRRSEPARGLAGVLGRGGALVVAFLASGLAHEAAISWPVRAGYGGPLAYFLIHGVLVWGERARGWRPGVLAPVFLPLPLLFHTAFVESCLWPLIAVR